MIGGNRQIGVGRGFGIRYDDAINHGIPDDMGALLAAKENGYGNDGFASRARGEKGDSPFHAVVTELPMFPVQTRDPPQCLRPTRQALSRSATGGRRSVGNTFACSCSMADQSLGKPRHARVPREPGQGFFAGST